MVQVQVTMALVIQNVYFMNHVWKVIWMCVVCYQGIGAKFVEEPASATYSVEAVQGGMAKLPCDIIPAMPGDKMHIVIWFKEGENRKTPIYSFDSRDKLPEQGKHWHDESVLGARAHFRYQDKPAILTLDSVRDSDGGIYHCRVDFKQTPTRNIKVNLTIIIPPDQLSVLDETGVHISNYILGPYNEGSSVNITCVATGGRPPPRVTWWQENALLDDSFEYLKDRRVRNILHLEKLERKHLHTVFTCQASNNNLVAPISSSVTLDINLRPLRVKLLGENKALSADNTYELSCEVVGSRPQPTITWWKGSVQMKNTRETTSPDLNTTTSVLTFTPTVEDGGKYLSCRGQQPYISDSGLEDGWKLDIYHVPLVTLELGSTLNGSTIKEGVDVYFECNIKSNPWVYKVSWRHNGKQLYNNAQANTIVSNQSLVLQAITRSRSGHYTCVGHNQEGDGESNSVQLDVKFIPTCRPAQPKVFGVARHETARILCEVEANPTDVQFIWKFNNSADTVDIPQNQIYSERTRSTAAYKPMTEGDYGTLLCWGRNEIGMQKEPCVFYINPAGKPDALSNCTILNQTAESLHVECTEGFDGGLQQEFIMEVYDTQTRKLVSNVTSKNPIFTVGGLESGLGFDIGLYASNKKGRSDVSHLHAFTLKSAEKHTVKISKPLPPENCTLLHHSRFSLRIRCQVSEQSRDNTYFLQVFDADSRVLIGTATALIPQDIVFNNMPRRYDDLLIFIRTKQKTIMSDANIIYVPKNTIKTGASTPALLQITPLLGALIGVVAALILVAVIIVVVIRLRGGGERDDKDYDDGGLSSSGRRCVAGNGDKASTEPLNKDLNDSVDSLEEKNPDIIPQNNAEDDYQDEERAFERLNNAPLRVYSRMQSPNNQTKNGGYDGYKTTDEITYAELSLTNQQMPHVIYNQQAIPMSVIRRQEPTVYAQIDMKRIPQCLQPLSPPHPSSFQTLHHPHLPAYIPRPLREEQLIHENAINAETPLMSPRDSSALQPLLDVSSTRTPTMTSTQPRTVSATRF
ncbi:hemicentin-1-like isoform X1 [Tribolium madens]|uniref:hemicentin-1-like isoform X1 n=1 Tax=Tribolium madens TaxID=41895 RepID=UPI001CF73469|nr:hemicentin-1-like isoform X1 [Tribolium madens]